MNIRNTVTVNSPTTDLPIRLAWWFVCIGLFISAFVIIGIEQHFAQKSLIIEAEDGNVALTYALGAALWEKFSPLIEAAPRVSNTADLLSNPQFRALDSAVRNLIRDQSILKVKIYHPSGFTVYSSAPSQVGEVKGSENAGFMQAVTSATPASQLSQRDSFTAFSEERYGISVVETYVPMIVNRQVVGVFEIYTDVTPVYQLLARARTVLALSISTMFMLTAAGMWWWMRRATQVIQEREAQIQRLEKTLSTESEIISEAAHEFRSPLSSILWELEVVTGRPRSSEQYRDTLESVKTEVAVLTQLLEDLATLERVEYKEEQMALLKRIAPSKLMEAVLTRVRSALDAAECKLTINVINEQPVLVNPNLIVIAITNLLNNVAIHAPKSQVTVTFDKAHDGDLRCIIEDRGAGMVKGMADKAFNLGASSRIDATHQPGSGRGLAIVRKIARWHQGDCTFEHRSGGGCRFTLTTSIQQ
ncbi:MAG: HAMP domain-containing histidine kinase [Gammaproteobacteria bacterium]|nr:HAMP domain-containing histidine kinase [Gammaproteobacteria bacterium]